jgi:hypothetical protein
LRHEGKTGRHFCVVVCVVTPRCALRIILFSPSHCQRIQSVSLRVQSDVRVVCEHLARDVPCYRHDGAVARRGLGKFRDGLMP